MHATVFVPEGKVGIFVRKFEAYADEAKDSKPKDPEKVGKPKNKDLVASISQLRRAVLKSFWMTSGVFQSPKMNPFGGKSGWMRRPTHTM